MQELATMGDIACFSFQNDKLMTAGEGGAVATDSLEHATAIRRFLNQGRSGGRFAELVSIGFNGRMTAWQAAVLSAQLDRFREQWEMRLRSAKRLGELIVETVGLTSVSARASLSSQSMYSFITEYDSAAFSGLSRDAFLAALAAEGIRCSKGYARPLHEWQAFQGAECRVLACPNAEGLCLKSVTFKHSVLLAPPARMESIAAAIHKLHRFSYELTQGEVEKGA
jgi:dTDP-4-amino-4,6-dideoxygalactose transaminase